jgi:peroxiredoxin
MSVQPVCAEVNTPAKGESFPDVTLPVPDKTDQKDYLGITAKSSFKISQIKSELIIVEIYSMYCPYCQKEAPLINELFTIIDKKGMRDKIKIIGIGAGNTPFEVELFKKQYSVPFPLLSDELFTIHKAVGEVRTPYFFVLKKTGSGANKIIYSKVGSIQDPSQFLDMILKESALQ